MMASLSSSSSCSVRILVFSHFCVCCFHYSSLSPHSPNSIDSKGKETAAMKADLLRARNMKRYINQLTVAKKQCEKRIRLLGGPNYEQQEDGNQDEGDGPQGQKVRIIVLHLSIHLSAIQTNLILGLTILWTCPITAHESIWFPWVLTNDRHDHPLEHCLNYPPLILCW